MPETWSTDAVLALAPDAASASAGRGLATPAKWASRGMNSRLAWGEALGSGANPYQVVIDLAEPAFKCSCPSRKFPCKHALGLLLMVAGKSVTESDPPQFALEWLEKRDAKTAAKASAEPKAPVDAESQAKRLEKRRERVLAGVEEARLWVRDLARRGIGNLGSGGYRTFAGLAERLVDAQAPGLARRLRRAAELCDSGDGWQGRVGREVADIHLLLEAYLRIGELPPALQEDAQQAIGFTIRKEDLPPESVVGDTWSVLGQRRFQEDRIEVQRSWLYGQNSGRWAMVLAFSAANQRFDPLLLVGTAFVGDVAFYPGAQGLRAIPGERSEAPFVPSPQPTGLSEFAQLLARCPWTEVGPLYLQGAQLDPSFTRIAGLPLVRGFSPWKLLALTGNAPADVVGEWDGVEFVPLAVFANRRLVEL